MKFTSFRQHLDKYDKWLQEAPKTHVPPRDPATTVEELRSLLVSISLLPPTASGSSNHRPPVLQQNEESDDSDNATLLLTTSKDYLGCMPTELILHVVSYLLPADLLSLSNTCNHMYQVLRTKHLAQSTWTSALLRITNLPARPEDLSEVRYTALVFGRNCFACGSDGAYSVDYALRLRCCESCYTENVVEGYWHLPEYPEVVVELATKLLPSEATIDVTSLSTHDFEVLKIDPLIHSLNNWYSKPAIEALLNLLMDPPSAWFEEDPERLLREVANVVLQRQMHGVILQLWDTLTRSVGVLPSEEIDTLKCWNDLVHHLRFQRYVEPDSPLAKVPMPATAHDIALRACEHPKSVDQIETEFSLRDGRQSRARDIRYARRHAEVERHYEDALARVEFSYLPDRSLGGMTLHLLPNRSDGATILRFFVEKGDGYGVPTLQDCVEAVKYNMTTLQIYSSDYARELSRLSRPPSKFWVSGSDGKRRKYLTRNYLGVLETLLSPFALFYCSECHRGAWRPYTYWDLHRHWRTTHKDTQVLCIDEEGNQQVTPRAGYWIRSLDVVLYILRNMVLEDPYVTSWDLGRFVTERRLFCACGDPAVDPALRPPQEGPAAWSEFAMHVQTHIDDVITRGYTVVAEQSEEHPVTRYYSVNSVLERLITYIPDEAGAGFYHGRAGRSFEAGPDEYADIIAHLGECPDDWSPVCALCRATIDWWSHDQYVSAMLPPHADRIAYHLRTRHEVAFSEEHVKFEDSKGMKALLKDAYSLAHCVCIIC